MDAKAFEVLFKLATELLAVVDFDGSVRLTNPAWEQELGFSDADLSGRKIVELIHEDDRQEAEEKLKNIFSLGGTLSFDSRLRFKGGTFRRIGWTWTASVVEQCYFVVGRGVGSAGGLSDGEGIPGLITRNSSDMFMILDRRGRMSWISPAMSRILGFARDEKRGRSICTLTTESLAEPLDAFVQRALMLPGETQKAGFPFIHSDGREVPVQLSAVNHLARPMIGGILLTVTAGVADNPVEIKHAATPLPDIIQVPWRWNRTTDVFNFSVAWQTLIGERAAPLALHSRDFFERIHPDDLKDLTLHLQQLRSDQRSYVHIQLRLSCADGSERWVFLEAHHLEKENREISGVIIGHWRNSLDPLTGLPNRVFLAHHLQKMLSVQNEHTDYRFAVLLIDLDRFNVINDSLGRRFGDMLLVATAQRIKTRLGPGDLLVRIGSDEFGVLTSDLKSFAGGENLAAEIQEAMRPPFTLEATTVFSSVSIGIATSERLFNDAEDMVRAASLARHRSKSRGTAQLQTYQSEMSMQALSLFQLGADLRKAIERNEFVLHYQPIVSLANNRVMGFEALIRWNHPTRGLVFPDEFIEYAEDEDLIRPISWWVMREACEQMRRWQTTYPDWAHASVSVNISRKLLESGDLIGRIDEVLKDTGLPAEHLMLEITESAIMQNSENAARILSEIRRRGVRLSIDDFGTGFSSLSYLFRFPVSTLKIDRSFIHRLKEGEESREIIKTILLLARNMKMEAIAEGVETVRDLNVLRSLNCKLAQGYYFAKPQAPDALRQNLLTAGTG